MGEEEEEGGGEHKQEHAGLDLELRFPEQSISVE